MRNKGVLANIDNSDLVAYPNGRIKNNTGAGDGTPVNEQTKGDIHEFFDKLLRLYGITHNGLPDNETNGYQTIDALIALASKNDYLIDITTVSNVIQIPLKLSKLKNNEAFLCKCNFDKTTETTIKGTLDGAVKSVVFVGDFKSGDYLRVVNTASNVVITRLADSSNINTLITELAYLKAASNIETIAGLLTTKAVTPASFLAAFAEYVNGATATTYLATALLDGLYPKEHFSIVAGLGANPVRNIGSMTGLNIGGGFVGQALSVTGDIVSATITAADPSPSGGGNKITVVLANTMTDTNYYVRSFYQSQSIDSYLDNAVGVMVFKPINDTTFEVAFEEFKDEGQNLKIHLEVVKI